MEPGSVNQPGEPSRETVKSPVNEASAMDLSHRSGTNLGPRDTLEPPSTMKLNNHFILGEMIDHLQRLFTDTTDVDLDILVDWLTAVRNHQVDLQTTLRNLLRAFWPTNAFKEHYDLLDEDIRVKIKAFADGKSGEKTLSNGVFDPKPSPRSHHRFRLLDFMKNLVHHEHVPDAASLKQDMERRRDAFRTERGLPVIYEDKEEKKVMEVCNLSRMRHLQILY